MILDEIKRWMTFIGWTDGGNPGSVKKDAHGMTIAAHGDATWIEDVQDCCARAERAAAIAELERRASLKTSNRT